MKPKKFNYFANHGDEEGRNCYTICYGTEEDEDFIIVGAEDRKKDAIEVCKRLNSIIKVSPADKEQIKSEFTAAERALKALDPSHENLDATRVYEVLEFLRDKCLGLVTA